MAVLTLFFTYYKKSRLLKKICLHFEGRKIAKSRVKLYPLDASTQEAE